MFFLGLIMGILLVITSEYINSELAPLHGTVAMMLLWAVLTSVVYFNLI